VLATTFGVRRPFPKRVDVPAMMRFRCLGSVELTQHDGSPVEQVLVQPKRVALLSYIALFDHGGFVPRDRLLEVFWPEADTCSTAEERRSSFPRLQTSSLEPNTSGTLLRP
jgi:hypothetical protein